MKTKKLIKAARRLKKYCLSYGNYSCEDCIFRPTSDQTKCLLKNIPVRYDIKKIQENAESIEKNDE